MSRDGAAAGAEAGATRKRDAGEERDAFGGAECQHRAAGVGRPALMVSVVGVGECPCRVGGRGDRAGPVDGVVSEAELPGRLEQPTGEHDVAVPGEMCRLLPVRPGDEELLGEVSEQSDTRTA